MVKQKQKYYFKEPIAIANVVAAIVAIIALFSILFHSPTVGVIVTNGFYLIVFAVNAYFARARILGYVFPNWLNWVMFLAALGTILVSIWGILLVV